MVKTYQHFFVEQYLQLKSAFIAYLYPEMLPYDNFELILP